MRCFLFAVVLLSGVAASAAPIREVSVQPLRVNGKSVSTPLERLIERRGLAAELRVDASNATVGSVLAVLRAVARPASVSTGDSSAILATPRPCDVPGQATSAVLIQLRAGDISLSTVEARLGPRDCVANTLQLSQPQVVAEPVESLAELEDDVDLPVFIAADEGASAEEILRVAVRVSARSRWLIPLAEARPEEPSPALIVFGGSAPASVGEEVSLEVQVEKLESALANRSPSVMFGAGESKFVRVLKAVPRGGALAALVGSPGLPARRPTTLSVEGPAGREELLTALEGSAGAAGGTVVFGVGHGTRPKRNGDGSIDLAGTNGRLWVSELERSLDAQPRSGDTALVLGHCFSGAFARIARKRSAARRCALTAVPPDRPSDGCVTEEADRSVRAYAWMIGEALGRAAESDVNGDGRVTLAEAHAFARIHDPTANVPYSSSEDWIRYRTRSRRVDGTVARAMALATEEDRAVLQALQPDFVEGRTRLREIRRVHRKRMAQLSRSSAVDRVLAEELDEIRGALQREMREEIETALAARTRAEVALLDRELARDPRLRDLIKMHGELVARDARRREEHHQIAKIERFLRAAELALLEAKMRKRDVKTLTRIRACEALAPLGSSDDALLNPPEVAGEPVP
ncbi:MAG: hypothetical protein AAFX94_06760 [Myxococcota bacterium]